MSKMKFKLQLHMNYTVYVLMCIDRVASGAHNIKLEKGNVFLFHIGNESQTPPDEPSVCCFQKYVLLIIAIRPPEWLDDCFTFKRLLLSEKGSINRDHDLALWSSFSRSAVRQQFFTVNTVYCNGQRSWDTPTITVGDGYRTPDVL